MKQYKTKTGIELKIIQGDGLGDGVPRGQLKLVQNETDYDWSRYETKSFQPKPSLIDTVLAWFGLVG